RNGDAASTWRISDSSLSSLRAPTGPGLRRAGAETLRRRRCSHAADRDTPATRHTVASGAGSSMHTASASATEGAPSSPQRPQDVVLQLQLTDLALRISELAFLGWPRPRLQPLTTSLKETPRASRRCRNAERAALPCARARTRATPCRSLLPDREPN